MAKKKTNGKPVAARFNLEARSETPYYYVNYMSVSHGAFDFTLSVVRIPALFSQEQVEIARKGHPITLEPTLQLVFPPKVAEGLIRALTTQVAKYAEDQETGRE